MIDGGGSAAASDSDWLTYGHGYENQRSLTARDTRTGKLLWRFQTRAGVNAPPVVYEAGGKEYVVVAAGGNKLFNMPMGNAVIGFGLAE